MAVSESYELGVIGAGAMGGAFVAGFIRRGALAAGRVAVYDVRAEGAAKVAADTGARVASDNQTLVDASAAVMIALKPQVLAEVVEPLQFRPDQLVISIAAGVPLAKLEALTAPGQPLVRVMPNLMATVGAAACGYSATAAVTGEQLAFVERLLTSVGVAVKVEEKLLDGVTGLSGSGPAFVAVFAEALADGGVAAGLPRADAAKLAAQLILGVGRWLQETGQSPAALKDQVTSPGGTTIAGLRALEAGGLRSATIEAVVAAALRSKELGG